MEWPSGPDLGLARVLPRVNPSLGSRRWNCGVYPIAPGQHARHDRYVANRILIVDDSPDFRAVAAELLAERGFDVLMTAADGEQALAAVANRCPDGILLDLNLPGPDGFAVAASLAVACPAARIVLTSADVASLPGEVLRDCAVAAFVPKEDLAAADLRMLFRPEGR
jgi:CheY-like chemotaxis protein